MTARGDARPGGVAAISGAGGRPGLAGNVVALVVWAAVVARAFSEGPPADRAFWYAGGLLLFLVIQQLVLWLPALPVSLLYVAFTVQAAIVLVLLSLDPDVDFFTALLALEAYQAAVLLTGRSRFVWVGVLLALIAVSLVLGLGLLDGLALAFVPMAAGLVLAMFAVASRELEAARIESEAMVADLREAQRRLEEYAGQVEELAAIEERSRVARELESSVSTTLDDALASARLAREALEAADAPPAADAPHAASAALERLQALTQEALAQMRRVIAELRPPAGAAEGAEASAAHASAAHPSAPPEA